jgi:DNA-binding beta-propeller fold protein YncE
MLLVAVVVVVLSLTAGDEERSSFTVDGEPASLVVTRDGVWVAFPATGTVQALDPVSGRSLGPPLRTGGRPSRLTAGADSLWAVDSAGAAIIPIQRRPGRAFDAIPVGADVTDAAVAGGAVWVLSAAEGVLRIVEPRGQPVEDVPVGTDPVDVAAAGRWVVVAAAGSGTLARIDAEARVPSGPPVELGGVPAAVAVTGDRAWVADAERDTVTPVDLARGEPGAPIDVGVRPLAVAADGDDVYVLGRGELVRVDGGDGEVRSRSELGGEPVAIALDIAHVWIADAGGTVERLER